LTKLAYTNKFKKDYSKFKKKLYFEEMNVLFEVIRKLKNNEKLEDKFVDHKLNDSKDYKSYRYCHIRPGMVLISK
jgi:mRNA interferase YafQ